MYQIGQQKLQDPKNLNIMTIDDGSGNNTKVQVSWQFSFQNDRFGKDTIEFRVKLAELLRKADIAPWKKIFRWTQWEEAIVAEKVLLSVINSFKVRKNFFS